MQNIHSMIVVFETKGDMKKTWATLNETLNRSNSRTAFPSNLMINNISVKDSQEMVKIILMYLFIDAGSYLSNK